MEGTTLRKIARNVLGGTLVFAGISHLTFARKAFRAQVPDWVPLEKDDTVVSSGIVEIALGGALVLADEEHQELVGKIAAAFFVAVFPRESPRSTSTGGTPSGWTRTRKG